MTYVLETDGPIHSTVYLGEVTGLDAKQSCFSSLGFKGMMMHRMASTAIH